MKAWDKNLAKYFALKFIKVIFFFKKKKYLMYLYKVTDENSRLKAEKEIEIMN